jgi:hypothetical protein
MRFSARSNPIKLFGINLTTPFCNLKFFTTTTKYEIIKLLIIKKPDKNSE